MQQSTNPKYDTRNWFSADVPLPGAYGQGNCRTSLQYHTDAPIQLIVHSGPAHAARVSCEFEEDLEKVLFDIRGQSMPSMPSTSECVVLHPYCLTMFAQIKQQSDFKGKVQIELTLCQPNHNLRVSGAAQLIIQDLKGESLAVEMNDTTQAICLDCAVDTVSWDLKGESRADIRDLRSNEIYIHAFDHSVVQVPSHEIMQRVECYDQARIIGAGDPQWVADYLTGKR